LSSRCLVDADLSRLASKLIVSFINSDDIVSRLSLGSVRDIRNAALWLCEANESGGREGYSVVTHRTSQWKSGEGTTEDMHWVSTSSLFYIISYVRSFFPTKFLATRKTLEANMQMSDLFPPGRVFWARGDGDLPHSQRTGSEKESTKVRLFEVLDTEKVFSQIVFSKNMLRYANLFLDPSYFLLISSVFIVHTYPIDTTKLYTSCYNTDLVIPRADSAEEEIVYSYWPMSATIAFLDTSQRIVVARLYN
jgi:hypothetical protein